MASASPASSSQLSASIKQKLPSNGLPSRSKTAASDPSKSSASSVTEMNVTAKHANDRLLFLTANFVGHHARLTVKSGDQFTGIFSSASLDQPDYHITLKMTKRAHPTSASDPSQANGISQDSGDYVGFGEDHVMTFDLQDVVHFNVPNVNTSSLQSRLANGSGFKTDADIAGHLAVRERELQRWEPTEDSSLDLSMNGASSGAWDQFETNARLYGVKTDYDENFYTTSIDRSHPTYKQRAAAADRLAREIETSATTNAHVAEERNLKIPDAEGALEGDEEAKYSGVIRNSSPLASSQTNKYTPPARRAPMAHSTVPGAPVDPAIISSQLARPDYSNVRATLAESAVAPLEALKENEEPNASRSILSTTDGAANKPVETVDTNQLDSDKMQTGKEISPSSTLQSSTSNIDATSQEAQDQGATDNTANVENRVADAFRSFAAIEKQNYREKQKAKARSEREFRLNDLKKFSANFKLHTVVPEDILGILAREKPKQVEIKEKAQLEVEEHKAALADKAQIVKLADDSEASSVTGADNQADVTLGAPTAPAQERSAAKNQRGNQMLQGYQGRKGDRNMQHQSTSMTSPRVPGNLGARLMAQQQYRDPRSYQPLPQIPPFSHAPMPPPQAPQQPQQLQQPLQHQQQAPPPVSGTITTINTDLAMPKQSASVTPTSSLSRFNVQAMEFKPNPTATTFQPNKEESSTAASASRDGSRPPKRPINRVPFFADKRPSSSGASKSVLDHFNPIGRMKKEIIEAKKSKDFAANGGIPQAYRTPPVWEAGKGNEDKSYVELFEQGTTSAPSVSPASYAMAHQLPPHLQQGPQPSPPSQTPQQTYSMRPPTHPRDNYFDDQQRMHLSSSQQSSVQPSPSMRQPMLAYPPQMAGNMQPQFVQNVGQFPMGMNGQPMGPIRQFSAGPYMTPQGTPISAPMMPSHSSNGQYLSFPVQGGVPMYSPGAQQMFPAMMPPQHTPPGGYPSPRPGSQMMVHHGSQQGPGGPPFTMTGPNQQSGPGYYGKQHHPNQYGMRGGVPMMQQNSYGAHIPPQFPTQHRGSAPQPGTVGYGYGQIHPSQMTPMAPNQQHHAASMRHMSDNPDVK